MTSAANQRREACAQKTTAELDGLAARGVRAGGNAMSPILVAKGERTADEVAGAEPFLGADGAALKASLKALGYAPEDWEWLLTCDDAAAAALREAYAEDLTIIESFEEAMLEPGYVVQLCGMRVLNLGGFADALADPRAKQQMWARLKRIPPLGEPY